MAWIRIASKWKIVYHLVFFLAPFMLPKCVCSCACTIYTYFADFSCSLSRLGCSFAISRCSILVPKIICNIFDVFFGILLFFRLCVSYFQPEKLKFYISSKHISTFFAVVQHVQNIKKKKHIFWLLFRILIVVVVVIVVASLRELASVKKIVYPSVKASVTQKWWNSLSCCIFSAATAAVAVTFPFFHLSVSLTLRPAPTSYTIFGAALLPPTLSNLHIHTHGFSLIWLCIFRGAEYDMTKDETK